MKLIIIAFLVAGLGNCSKVQAFDNTITIDQVGSNNNINITQEGVGHSASVLLGSTAASDANNITILQQGTGAKSTSINIPNGYNNGVNVTQDGAGNHTLLVTGTQGTSNSGNNISATQSGGVGADKAFNLELNGTSGATVSIQQMNPYTANNGSMSITCNTGSCGNYSYIRQ
jgi:hypothetical protein